MTLDFFEPCYAAAACAAGQVNRAGQRVENVYANDAPLLANLDAVKIGATDTTAASRSGLAVSAAGQIAIRVQTVIRSGILSRVTISPPHFDQISTGQPGQPSRIFLSQGPAPPDTIVSGTPADAVLYIDSADGKLKILKLDGSTVILSQIPITRSTCIGSGPTHDCSGIDLYTFTLPDSTIRQQVAVPATPDIVSLPDCPAISACWQIKRIELQ